MKDIEKKFPESIGYGNHYDLVDKIHTILHGVDDSMAYERYGPYFNLKDIFTILPSSITFKGHRGDLCVSSIDIAYFSVDSDWKHILVHHEPIGIGENVFHAFYKMLIWLKENNLM